MSPDQQNPYGQQPQPNGSGQYSVVPPIPATPNTGHSGHNPYEFIVAAGPKRSSGFHLNNSTLLTRLVIATVGLIVLVVIALVAVAMLSPKGSTPGLTATAERQQEILRVASAAAQQASDQDTLNFIANVNLSVSSSKYQVVSYLSKHGVKLDTKTLALDYSSQTDTTLKAAQSAGTYNSAVVQNLVDQLTTYQSLLRSTYQQTTNKTAKALLQTSFASADKLLLQAKNIQARS